jgi:anti-anti-sigma factor
MLKPSVQVHNDNGVMIAEFWDCFRLDPAPVQELRKKYEAHLVARGRPELVVDLLGVGFAGSAALGNFVALHRVARQNDGRLIFCNVDPNVIEVLRVSRLDPLFSFAADRPAAVAQAFAPRQASSPDAGTSAPMPPGDAARKSGGGGLLRSSRRRKLS